MNLIDGVLLLILLVLSGFFSGIEIAFFSVSSIRVRHLAEKKARGSETLKKLKSDPHRLLITILIGNNLVNIGASALATVIAVDFFGSKGAGIAVGVMTLLILVFGEITPKSFATVYAEKISLLVSKPIYILQKIFLPVTFFLDKFVKVITKVAGEARYDIQKISEEELKSIINISHEAGGIGKEEKDMIHRIFQFDDTEAREIIIPKKDVYMLNTGTNISDLLKFLKKNKFTRIPVYEGNRDNVIGILYVKDLIPHLKSIHSMTSLKSLVREVMFIPGSKKIDCLLREFQRKKQHIAIVVDDYGSVQGIVTIEDIIEEIVGEIYDEDERRKEPLKLLDSRTALVEARTPVQKVNDCLRLGLQTRKRTLGGFVLEKLGRIPKEGEKIWFDSFIIIINRMDDHRISDLKIQKKKGKFRFQGR